MRRPRLPPRSRAALRRERRMQRVWRVRRVRVQRVRQVRPSRGVRPRVRWLEHPLLHPLWRPFKRWAQCAMFYVLLLHLGGMSLTWNLISVALYPLLTRAQGVVVGRAAISSVYRGFWACAQWLGLMRIDSTALDALRHDAGLIIAANHPTMLDALVVVARVPRGVCVMRASLMRNPFLGAGAQLARYIRNDPPRSMIRSAVANLKAGGQLVLFPEGTRTTRAPVDRFRPGITLIAAMAQVPIQTVLLEVDSPYLRKGWAIWRAPPFPVVIRARLGERFAAQADHAGLLTQLDDYFAAALGGLASSREDTPQ